MPNSKSAIKRVRQTKQKTINNMSVRSAGRTAVKKVRAAIEKGDKELSSSLLIEANRTLAVASKNGIIHKNNQSRRISRLAKQINKLNNL
ncbi:MAG: 30S ribosomal protein S20 [Nitrospinota bacterium]